MQTLKCKLCRSTSSVTLCLLLLSIRLLFQLGSYILANIVFTLKSTQAQKHINKPYPSHNHNPHRNTHLASQAHDKLSHEAASYFINMPTPHHNLNEKNSSPLTPSLNTPHYHRASQYTNDDRYTFYPQSDFTADLLRSSKRQMFSSWMAEMKGLRLLLGWLDRPMRRYPKPNLWSRIFSLTGTGKLWWERLGSKHRACSKLGLLAEWCRLRRGVGKWY